jgi:hypothetical protein
MFIPKSTHHRPRLRVAAAVLAFSACTAAGADSSSAITGACLEDSSTVRACSDRQLSNVVVQCGDESGSYFVKYDGLDEGRFEGLTSPYEGGFNCPTGDVLAVFIKSGRNRYDGPPIAGLPKGSGAAWYPLACGTEGAGCVSDEDGSDESAEISE